MTIKIQEKTKSKTKTATRSIDLISIRTKTNQKDDLFDEFIAQR